MDTKLLPRRTLEADSQGYGAAVSTWGTMPGQPCINKRGSLGEMHCLTEASLCLSVKWAHLCRTLAGRRALSPMLCFQGGTS